MGRLNAMSNFYLTFFCKRVVKNKPYGKFPNIEIISVGNDWDKVIINLPYDQYFELTNDISKLAKIVNEVRPENGVIIDTQLEIAKAMEEKITKKKTVSKPYYRKERW
jgi:hypothetical protein